jgi:hypothetical protein
MGREIKTTVHLSGKSGLCGVHLESEQLILRGDLKATWARAELHSWQQTANGLHLHTPGGELLIELEPAEAARWLNAALKTPPTLLEKLGLMPNDTVHWLTNSTRFEALKLDVAIQQAKASEARWLWAEIFDAADLARVERALCKAPLQTGQLIWLLRGKGKDVMPEKPIHEALGKLNLAPRKTARVSETIVADCYGHRKSVS